MMLRELLLRIYTVLGNSVLEVGIEWFLRFIFNLVIVFDVLTVQIDVSAITMQFPEV